MKSDLISVWQKIDVLLFSGIVHLCWFVSMFLSPFSCRSEVWAVFSGPTGVILGLFEAGLPNLWTYLPNSALLILEIVASKCLRRVFNLFPR